MNIILVNVVCLFWMMASLVTLKTSLFIPLCILRDLPQQKITRELCSGGDRAIFLCSHGTICWWDRSGKFKNTRRKGTNKENSRKQEGNNGGKKEKRSVRTWRFPYWCVCHWLGMPSGYHTCATLCQESGENPLVWEPPLQHHKIGKKNTAPPVLLINPCIQVIIQAIVSSVRSNYRKQLSYHL